jgi:tRNA(fMet)-specific endonuclease VapC
LTRFLLDTDVLSEPTKVNPDRRLLMMLSREAHRSCTSAVVWTELLFGVGRLPAGRRRDRLHAYVSGLGRMYRALPFDAGAAEWLAMARVQMEKRGIRRPKHDAMIAATAVSEGLVLVTRNAADFSDFPGLTVERWHS